jgi:hypothetical protein
MPRSKGLRPMKGDREGLVRCRVCRCTDREPCFPPCGWAGDDKRGDLCTTCAEIIFELQMWFECAHRPSKAALLRELDHRQGDGDASIVKGK